MVDPSDKPPTAASFILEEGQSIKLSGTVSHSGSESGNLLVQVLQAETGAPPKLLHSESMAALGPFSINAPGDLGEVSVVAFMDVDGNGMPSSGDLGARTDINIQAAPVSELSLALGDLALLGDLAPGREMPGEGAEAPDDGAGEAPPPAPGKGGPTEPEGPADQGGTPQPEGTPDQGGPGANEGPPAHTGPSEPGGRHEQPEGPPLPIETE